MKKLLFILFASIILMSCGQSVVDNSQPTSDSTYQDSIPRCPVFDFEGKGFVYGMVVNSTVASCGYIIEVDHMKFEPSKKLDSLFSEDSLTVWVKYSVLPKSISTCQIGPVISIDSICRR